MSRNYDLMRSDAWVRMEVYVKGKSADMRLTETNREFFDKVLDLMIQHWKDVVSEYNE